MFKFRKNSLVFAILLALLLISFPLHSSMAKDSVQRSGTIEDVAFEGLYTFITLKDGEGKTFFVVTEVCKAVPDSRVDVIRAEHVPRMNIPPLGGEVSDVYLAKLIKIDGREVIATTNEGLIPQGCRILK